MFNTRGLISLPDFRWERALLSLGNYFLPSGYNRSFLVNSASEQASWKRLLRGGVEENVLKARSLLQNLLDLIDFDASVESQLDEMIASGEGLELWRQIMVDTPEFFAYCGDHALRWHENDIYLLKKSRMSGMHAELFSYHLYTQLGTKQMQKKLLPLRLVEYEAAIGTEYEPSLYLGLTIQGREIYPLIYSDSGSFRIQLARKSLKPVPDLEKLLVETFSFEVQKELITLAVARERIQPTLCAMAKEIRILEAQSALA